MRKVSVRAVTSYKKELLWEWLRDIKSYPKHITFVRNVEVNSKMQEGVVWYDTTGILWIPMTLEHITTEWKEKNKLAFRVKMPFNGNMEQSYSLESVDGKTHVIGTIFFEFNNILLDTFVGPLLARRLEYMLSSSFKRIERHLVLNA